MLVWIIKEKLQTYSEESNTGHTVTGIEWLLPESCSSCNRVPNPTVTHDSNTGQVYLDESKQVVPAVVGICSVIWIPNQFGV